MENIRNDQCKCGTNGTLRHALLTWPLGLKERYTWRYNEVLRVFKKYLDEKITDIDKRKLQRKKIDYHREGKIGEV